MKGGWNPASVVRAVTEIDGVPIAFYSLHICGFKEFRRGRKLNIKDSHAYKLATEVLPNETTERVIVVGDYNIAHEEIDIHAPKRNEKTSGFLRPERDWMTKWFTVSGLVDTFRHLHPEKVAYSWWSYRANARNNNKGWRIDYMSLSKEIIDQVRSVDHYKEAVHSDHCAILLDLK